MATVDELNFRLIIDDSEFNKKVEEVLETANDLNATLSDILDLKKNASSLSSQEFQTLKRLAELESQRKINSEKEALAAERRAAAMEREALATEALKQQQAENLRAQEQINAEKIEQATQATALAYQKVGTEVQKTATEAKKTEQAQKKAAQEGEKAAQAAAKTALAQQKVTTETQKTAAEAQKTAAAAQKVATENQRTATEAQKTAAAHKKIATEAAKAATEVEKQKLLQQKAQTEAERTSLTHLRIRQAIDQENTGLRKQSQIWMQLKNLSTAYFSVLGATRLVSALVRTTAEFELQRTTLGAILQDVEKANVLYEQMKDLAVKSPFNFKELATYAKQLSAYSIPVDQLYDTTKMLADVSAGLGVSMDRLVLAYGQIRSASFLRGQEVRQLTEAGIPILEELRKQFVELGEEGITVGEVFDKISKRMVPFEMVSKVFKDMTSEGGKFYQMQEVQAETLRGKLSNLKDAYQIMFSEIGEKQDGLLKGSVDFLRSLADNYEKIGKALTSLIAIYGIYRVTLLATQLVEMGMVQAHLGRVSLLRGMGAVIEMLTKKSKAYLAVQSAIKKIGNPYLLLVTGVLSLSVGYIALAHSMEEGARGVKNFNDYLEKQNKLLEENAEKAREFIEIARNADNTYEDRIRAVRELVRIYPDLLRHYKDEQDILENILTLNKSLESIELTRRFEADNARLASLRESLRKAEEAIEANRTGWGAQAVPAIQEQVKELKKEIQLLEEEMSTYDAPFFNGPTLDGTYKQLNGWRKTIADILNEVSSHNISLGLSFNSKNIDTNSLDDVIKEVQNRMKEVTESRANAVGIENDAVIASYDTQLRYLEKINKVLKGRASIEQKTNSERAKSQEQKDIETRIDLLKKLQSAYEQLKEYVSKERMPNVLQNLFSASDVPYDMVKRLDFVEQLTKEAEKLSKFDPEAADRLLSSLAKDPTSRLVESAKALEKYREEMQKLLAKDFDVKDANLGYDISKIISNLTTANQQARLTADNLKKDLLDQEAIIKANVKGNSAVATAYWLAYKAEAEKAIDEITQKEIEANKKAAQEKLNDLSGKAYKDILRNNGLNEKMLSDWGNKSIGQIDDIITNLGEALKDDNILKGVSEEVKSKAEQAGLSLETLRELLKAMLNIDLDNTSEEGFKKKLSLTKSITSEASKLASSFEDIGEALNNGTLQSLAEVFDLGLELTDAILDSDDVIKDIVDNAGKISNSVSVITMIVKVVIIMIEKIVDFFASSARAEQQAIDNAREFQRALRDIKAEADDGIFGDSQWTKTLSRLQDYKDKYVSTIGELQKEIAKGNEKAWWYSIAYFGLSNPSDENILAAYNAGLYNDEASAIIETLVKFRDSVSEIFSGLSDDIVNNMVEAFEETGDSAAHLEDAFASMGDSLVRSIMKSYLLQDVFKKYEEQIFSAIDNFAQSDRSQENIKRGLEEVKGVFDLMSADIQSLAPFFNEILGMGKEMFGAFEGGAESLSDGIKSITEDTANLLASYLNAIRADVSFNKTQIATISTDIKQILGLLPASPTLNDYLNQIQANTFNSAYRTEQILSRIDSMMGLGGEGSALRVITT